MAFADAARELFLLKVHHVQQPVVGGVVDDLADVREQRALPIVAHDDLGEDQAADAVHLRHRQGRPEARRHHPPQRVAKRVGVDAFGHFVAAQDTRRGHDIAEGRCRRTAYA